MPRFLVRFVQVRKEFRLQEICSICKMMNVELKKEDIASYDENSPFWSIFLKSSEEARKILSRSTLIREIIIFLAKGSTVDVLALNVKSCDHSILSPYKHSKFRLKVDDYGSKVSMDRQSLIINKFSFLPLYGKVDLHSPEITLIVECNSKRSEYWFGILVGEGTRHLVNKFDLKKRVYLGTTSMDAELSLIMCNIAMVCKGSIVYDPFVGTGSLLCAAGAFGAHTIGSDIDGRQMRGTLENGRNLAANIQQYSLTSLHLDCFVCDFSKHPLRSSLKFDAIITDPPYGVRAGAKQIGSFDKELKHLKKITQKQRSTRYPATIPYETKDLTKDLLNFASKFLKIGGRLVFWYPSEGTEASGCRLTPENIRKALPDCVNSLLFSSMMIQRCRHLDRWLVVYEQTGSIST